MADSDNAFFGLKVPEGTDRRELYKSQYRAIYTYKMSASELDEAFRTAVTGDGPDGGWSIKNDERVKYVGKLEVTKGEDTTLKARSLPPPCVSRLARAAAVFGAARGRGGGDAVVGRGREPAGAWGSEKRRARAAPEQPFGGHHRTPHSSPCVFSGAQVTMEDYPEAGMSALKYYTVQSYTK